MKKKLFVIGDSWIYPSYTFPETHFTEIFAEHFDFYTTYLSQPGISNAMISVQIDTAIKYKPDLILISFTNTDRTEFAINDGDQLTDVDISSFYRYKTHESLKHVISDKTPSICSINWLSLFDDKFSLNIPDWIDKKDLLTQVYKNLYHESWKFYIDVKVLSASMYSLLDLNIPYIICIDHCNVDKSDFKGNSACNFPWITEKNDCRPQMMNTILENPLDTEDPGYHTSPKIQEILAESLKTHYQKYFINNL